MGLFDLFKEPNIDKMKGSNDAEGLLKALKHNQTFIRERAAKALGSLKDERAIEPLVQTLNDQSKEVQVAAAEALSHFDYSKIRHVWKYLDVKARRGAIEVVPKNWTM